MGCDKGHMHEFISGKQYFITKVSSKNLFLIQNRFVFEITL